ncbi:hypothetical protein [Nocardioides sp.]|uniref:GH39 family glycosyl hydrolase n=1 Tax=Nocardioides sp. TaxID=35761 RepID=UPI0025ED6639|nr:hypothetical protein [Nocardioides sp.]
MRAVLLGLIPLLMVGASLVSAPAQAQRVSPDFFGMHDANIAGGSVPGVAVGSVRLWDTGTAWSQIEKKRGRFDFTALDTAVNTARNAGLRPLVVLGQTPRFYASKPKAAGWYGKGASSMPKTISAWTKYVTKVAKRYKTSVDYQIWNEPNVVGFWSGSVSQMAKLTATGSAAINKAAGRRATVVAPSFPLRLASQKTWFKKYWAAKVGRKSIAAMVDVVAVNPYPLADQAPEASASLLSFAKRVLPKQARRKPMWNTEINYGLLGGDTAKSIPDATQAAYVARTLLLNAGASVDRVYWYSWRINGIANTHLVEDDGTTLTRAGRAWQVARGWIVDTDVSCAVTSKGALKGLYTCTARVGTNDVRRIYWKPSGGAVRVATSSTTTSSTDLDGTTTAHDGQVTLTVHDAPVMVSSRS